MARPTKWCGTCKGNKPLADFTKDKTSKDGLARLCKGCLNKRQNKLRQRHRTHSGFGTYAP